MKYYSITISSEKFKHEWLEKICNQNNIRILDFACGNGENGIYAASLGADVEGIDISPEGIDNATENAKNLKFQINVNLLKWMVKTCLIRIIILTMQLNTALFIM